MLIHLWPYHGTTGVLLWYVIPMWAAGHAWNTVRDCLFVNAIVVLSRCVKIHAVAVAIPVSHPSGPHITRWPHISIPVSHPSGPHITRWPHISKTTSWRDIDMKDRSAISFPRTLPDVLICHIPVLRITNGSSTHIIFRVLQYDSFTCYHSIQHIHIL